MKIFLSWSGNRSKYIAENLSWWIEQILQAAEPWISTEIEKGKRWNHEVSEKLESSKVAIICLTKENLNSNWIHFEAGAISKTQDAYLCTFLYEITPSEVEQPLSQFQHTKFEREDTYKLIFTINQIIGKNGGKMLREPTLVSLFDTFWPILQERLDNFPNFHQTNSYMSERELLEEALQILRGIREGVFPDISFTDDDRNSIIDYWINYFCEKNKISKYSETLINYTDKIAEYMFNVPEIPMIFGSEMKLKELITKRINTHFSYSSYF